MKWATQLSVMSVLVLSVVRGQDSQLVVPNVDTGRAALLNRINELRSRENLKPLTLNRELTKAAQSYAEFMAESGEFSHTAKGTMKSRAKEAGYDPQAIGENIARGQSSAAEVFDDWMDSKTHKANILSEDYSDIGIGVSRGKEGRVIWVADFGHR